jgi:23S rRNA pseudouridine2605 synthase
VTVDGQVVRQLGTRVDPTRARIAVDGEPIRLEPVVYFAVNKPKGYVSTSHDPSGRPRVLDLLPEIPQRVYTVGRLDEDSTGLMILTNDGVLANRLAHPRFGVEKLYRALLAGLPSPETLAKLTEGVWLSDGKVRAKRARVVGRQGQATVIELVLAEGKKREIRRMLAKLGHKVMSLNRMAVGPITLKGLPVGECRRLSRSEVELLRKVATGASWPAVEFPGAERSSRRRHAGSGPQGRPAGRPGSARRGASPARVRRAGAESAPGERRPRGGAPIRPPAVPQPAPPQQPAPVASSTGAGHSAHTQHPRVLESVSPPKGSAGSSRESRPPAGRPKSQAGGSPHAPLEDRPPRRRIIGLAIPGQAPSAPRTPARKPPRKRPAVRKPRRPRP